MTETSVAYALDFDGVVCNSVGESSETALKSAAKLWSHLSADEPHDTKLLSALREVRPVIETGYEYVLLGRLAIETDISSLTDQFVSPVLDDWPALRDSLMEKWDVSKQQLVEVFGSVRDGWIENNLDSWLGANQIFPGVVDAINFSSAPLYIITTKQARFCNLLLKKNGITNIPEDRVYGLGSGSKISVLKKLIGMPNLAGKTICFVEDRYETLEAVSISMLGQPLELHLATWGYNTAKTRSVAENHPFIELIDLPTFVNKLQ